MKALLVVAAVALIRGSFGNYAVLFLSFSITDNILKTFIYVAPLWWSVGLIFKSGSGVFSQMYSYCCYPWVLCLCVCVCFIFVCVCLRVCFSSRGNTLFFSSVTLMGFPWWLMEAQSNKQEMLVVLSRDWWGDTYIYCTQKPVYIKVSSYLSRNYAKRLWLCGYLRQNIPVGVTNVEEPVAGHAALVTSRVLAVFQAGAWNKCQEKGELCFGSVAQNSSHISPQVQVSLPAYPNPPEKPPPTDSCCDQ